MKTLPKEWPYAAALRDNELRTTDCERCPRCRRYPSPGKRQILVPQLGIVYHPDCYTGQEGLS